jgi:hypothetical protein
MDQYQRFTYVWTLLICHTFISLQVPFQLTTGFFYGEPALPQFFKYGITMVALNLKHTILERTAGTTLALQVTKQTT